MTAWPWVGDPSSHTSAAPRVTCLSLPWASLSGACFGAVAPNAELPAAATAGLGVSCFSCNAGADASLSYSLCPSTSDPCVPPKHR